VCSAPPLRPRSHVPPLALRDRRQCLSSSSHRVPQLARSTERPDGRPEAPGDRICPPRRPHKSARPLRRLPGAQRTVSCCASGRSCPTHASPRSSAVPRHRPHHMHHGLLRCPASLPLVDRMRESAYERGERSQADPPQPPPLKGGGKPYRREKLPVPYASCSPSL